MAEFTKVAHEWVRMCKAYSDAGDCMKCPMVTNPICGCMSDGNGASDKEISKAESDIMSWAAEHPEPVYPTWYEWLQTVGAITKETNSSGIVVTQYNLNLEIPIEVAQRHGIKPKEG